MSMSRKFYIDLAARLNAIQPHPDDKLMHQVWAESVKAVADSITGQGHTFDRQRFYEACGLT